MRDRQRRTEHLGHQGSRPSWRVRHFNIPVNSDFEVTSQPFPFRLIGDRQLPPNAIEPVGGTQDVAVPIGPEGHPVMTEVDTDGNGKMDQFSYYESPSMGATPRITRKERDTNGDTLIDIWERFDENGVVNRTGRDTDGDGKMDERDE